MLKLAHISGKMGYSRRRLNWAFYAPSTSLSLCLVRILASLPPCTIYVIFLTWRVLFPLGHNQKLYEYSSTPNGSTARVLERRRNVSFATLMTARAATQSVFPHSTPARRSAKVHRTLVATKAMQRKIAMMAPHNLQLAKMVQEAHLPLR